MDNIIAKLNSVKIPKQLSLKQILTDAIHQSISKNQSISDSIGDLVSEWSYEGAEKTSLHRYFNDIKRVYNENGNDFNIEYCADNREKLLQMNLKTVISVAKRYQGQGVHLEDLISAGNVGLCVAWEKFNPEKSKFRNTCLDTMESVKFPCSYKELYDIYKPVFEYGDFLSKFEISFNKKSAIEKSDMLKWINKNIPEIKFSSVASMWIMAHILSEIDNHSRIVRKPKSEIYKDKCDTGSYKRNLPVYMDDGDTNIELYDDAEDELDAYSNQQIIADKFSKLFEGIDNKVRSIILRKVGIGLPRAMSPKEIAEFEGITTARVSQLFQQGLKRLRLNAEKHGITHRQLSALLPE
nr:MAG TPA: RNA polymerase sigma factor [Caudoviricetes sp.]